MFQLCLLIIILNSRVNSQEIHNGMDILAPYISHHGPKHRTKRDTQECQSIKYGNVTHSMQAAYSNSSESAPLIQSYRMIKEVDSGNYWEKKTVLMLHQVIKDPLSTLSVVEPGFFGSCLNDSGARSTVRQTARERKCLYASNAGFFNTHNGHCLGNVVSNGVYVHSSGGIQNAHFGITESGNLFTGYLSELDYLSLRFKQLVGGVIWLVRDGESYVEESLKAECSGTEETGTLKRFVEVVSARTAVGYDDSGKVHIVQVNGLTDRQGVNLYQFAKILMELGVTNAINLDGGGSATSVINDTLVNFPSDRCPDEIHNCERAVSTILCVHYPECSVPDCSGHGVCAEGSCQCRDPWMGHGCETANTQLCGPHGRWTNGLCICEAGWHGPSCATPCSPGWFGANCSSQCFCSNHGNCHSVTGKCDCHVGYTGKFCHQECPYGFYGEKCLEVCFCKDSCFCDHVTGSCNVTKNNPDDAKAADCLIQEAIHRDHLVPDRQEQYSLCLSFVACLSVIGTSSLLLNAVLTYLLFRRRQWPAQSGNNSDSEASHPPRQKRFKRRKKRPREVARDGYIVLKDLQNVGRRGQNHRLASDHPMSADRKDLDSDCEATGSGEDENDLFLARKKKPAL